MKLFDCFCCFGWAFNRRAGSSRGPPESSTHPPSSSAAPSSPATSSWARMQAPARVKRIRLQGATDRWDHSRALRAICALVREKSSRPPLHPPPPFGQQQPPALMLLSPPFAQGRFGTVHVASYGLGSPIAVKQVHLSGHSNEESLRQPRRPRPSTLTTRNTDFLAEARHLSSPVVDLKFHGALVSDDWQGYLAMERMYGTVAELGRWMHRRRAAPPTCPPEAFRPLLAAVALRIMGDVADQLARLHKHGIVFRDVKGDNVMVGADLRLKLIDFGLARQGSAPFVDRQAQGTPSTISPERSRGQPYGFDTDLYGLGCLLARILLGRSVRPTFSAWQAEAETGRRPRNPKDLLDTALALTPTASQSPSRSTRSTSEGQKRDDRASAKFLRCRSDARQVHPSLADFIFGELLNFSPQRRPTADRAAEVAASLLLQLDSETAPNRPGRLPAAAASLLAEFCAVQQAMQRPYVEAVTRGPWGTRRSELQFRNTPATSRALLQHCGDALADPPWSAPTLARASV